MVHLPISSIKHIWNIDNFILSYPYLYGSFWVIFEKFSFHLCLSLKLCWWELFKTLDLKVSYLKLSLATCFEIFRTWDFWVFDLDLIRIFYFTALDSDLFRTWDSEAIDSSYSYSELLKLLEQSESRSLSVCTKDKEVSLIS